MDLNSVGKLLQTISIHYPSFKKHIQNSEGMLSKAVAEEWMRLIGFMTYEEALKKLDDHLLGEDSKFAPDVSFFLKHKVVKREEAFHAPIQHIWHIEFSKGDVERKHGRVYDQDGCEYVHDPMYDEGYHYDDMGRICTKDGRVAFK